MAAPNFFRRLCFDEDEEELEVFLAAAGAVTTFISWIGNGVDELISAKPEDYSVQETGTQWRNVKWHYTQGAKVKCPDDTNSLPKINAGRISPVPKKIKPEGFTPDKKKK